MYAVIDVETTGTRTSRHDRVVEIGVVGLPPHAVDEALADARELTPPARRWQLRPGDQIVRTGTMNPPREEWEQEARAAGLEVGTTVSNKRTRLLVAADPDSMSGKAKKARQCGIPIVHPQAYRGMLGVPVPA